MANTPWRTLKNIGAREYRFMGKTFATHPSTAPLSLVAGAPPGWRVTGTGTFVNAQNYFSSITLDPAPLAGTPLSQSGIQPGMLLFDMDATTPHNGATSTGVVDYVDTVNGRIYLQANWAGTGGAYRFWFVRPNVSYRWVSHGGFILADPVAAGQDSGLYIETATEAWTEFFRVVYSTQQSRHYFPTPIEWPVGDLPSFGVITNNAAIYSGSFWFSWETADHFGPTQL